MRLVLVALPVASFIACSHAQPAPVAAAPAPAPVQIVAEAPAPTPAVAPAAPPPQLVTVSVYFDYDSSELLPEVRAVLQAFFDQVQQHADQRIRIEGNCDERGTREYNLALGQRRAEAARKYLTDLGLDASRITALSNGKERPLAMGGDGVSWRENRRDDLIPISSGNAASAAVDEDE